MFKNHFLLIASFAMLFTACTKDPVSETTYTEESIEGMRTEMAYPNSVGTTNDVYYSGQKMAVEEINDELIFEGDIVIAKDMVYEEPVKLVLEPGEDESELKSCGRTSRMWTNKTVYYTIASDLPNQKRVTDAIAHWESKTSLRFVKRTNQSNYIYFRFGSGCSSYVGMIGGKQNITLANGCSTGNTIHEIGHAVGLWHEQSRADRNNYITIHWSNIKSGTENNFKTYAEKGNDGKDYTSNFDFGSIMMYGPYSFSTNNKPTITKKDGSTYSYQRNSLSSYDLQGINKMYPSNGNGGGGTTYENGKYYTIHGLKVYRYNNGWWYYSTKWRQVELRGTKWYYIS